MLIPDDVLQSAAFAAWAVGTPFHGRRLSDLTRERAILETDMGGGTTFEHDLLLDWELNRDTFTTLARAVLEAAEAARSMGDRG